MNYLQELQIAMPVTEKKKVLPTPNRRSQRWTVPKDGCLKFNVDGAQAKVSKRGACAVVCRDDAGRFQGSSAVVMDGISDPPTLEALACLEALSLAQDIGARQVYVSSDCAGVINAIKVGSRSHYSSVIREIQAMMPSFEVVLFTHEKRDRNVDAHNLAKFSSNLEPDRYLWLDKPCDPQVVPVITES
jgi:ribonuclease HI